MDKNTIYSIKTYGSSNSSVATTTVSSCLATVSNSMNIDTRWEPPTSNLSEVEDLHWLTSKLELDALPKKICPEICERCFDEKGKNFDEWYLNAHKKIKCPHSDKPLLIWRDKPPKACPFITEQTVSADENKTDSQ